MSYATSVSLSEIGHWAKDLDSELEELEELPQGSSDKELDLDDEENEE